MKQRLTDLRAPPVDLNTALSGGVLGGAIGESAAESAKRLEEAKKGANDLTSMVRKKKPAAVEKKEGKAESANGKRKADDVSEAESEAKKVKKDA